MVQDVFANAFITAMRPTLGVTAAGLLVGALSCLLIARRARPATAIQDRAAVDVCSEISSVTR